MPVQGYFKKNTFKTLFRTRHIFRNVLYSLCSLSNCKGALFTRTPGSPVSDLGGRGISARGDAAPRCCQGR